MESVPPNFRPRRDFLVVIGVFIVVIGCLHAFGTYHLLRSPATIEAGLTAEDLEKNAELPVDLYAYLFLALFQAGILAGLYSGAIIWLGIGSILAKRWAVKILHAMGWVIVAFGLFQCITQLLTIPLVSSLTSAQPFSTFEYCFAAHTYFRNL